MSSLVHGIKVATNVQNQEVLQGEIKWQPPDIGHLKLNVDVSIYAGSDSFTIGIILRNHNGLF